MDPLEKEKWISFLCLLRSNLLPLNNKNGILLCCFNLCKMTIMPIYFNATEVNVGKKL